MLGFMIPILQGRNVTQQGCVPCASSPGGGRAVFPPPPSLGGKAMQWVSETSPFRQADWEAAGSYLCKGQQGRKQSGSWTVPLGTLPILAHTVWPVVITGS